MFLDLFFGEKLFEKVMKNSRIKNKFWGYFWRAALMIAGAVTVIFLLVFSFAAMKGGFMLSYPQIVILIAVLLIVSTVTPVVQYLLWSSDRKNS